jgi:hypothetical protein
MRVHPLSAHAEARPACELEHADVLVLEQNREAAWIGACRILRERIGADAEGPEKGDDASAVEKRGRGLHR